MGLPAIFPILGILKWPLTIAAAVLIFGVSADGTLSLVSTHTKKPQAQTTTAMNSVNMPPVRQIGNLKAAYVAPVAPRENDGGLAVPSLAQDKSTVAVLAPSVSRPPDLTPGRIGDAAVNVRAGASKSSTRLTTLPAGTEIGLGEAQGGWIHIWYDGGDGWVYKTYIFNVGDITQPAPTTIVASDATSPIFKKTKKTESQIVEVGSVIAVRDVASADAVPIYRLREGDKIRIVERDGAWARIETITGEEGWVRIRE